MKIEKKSLPCIDYKEYANFARSVLGEALKTGGLCAGQIMASGIPKLEVENPIPFVEWFQAEFILCEDTSLPYCFILETAGGVQWVVSGFDCFLLAISGRGAE